MTAGRARRGFRGTVEAAALLLDEALLGRAELERRALTLWQPGCRLLRTGAGTVIVLVRPRRLAVATAPGLVLVAAGGAFAGFAIGDAELRALAPPRDALLLLRAGAPVVIADGTESSPAAWLELGALEIVTTAALDDPAVTALAAPAALSVQDALGPAVPPPAPARTALLREAAGDDDGTPARTPSRSRQPPWRALLALFSRRRRASSPRSAARGQATTELASEPGLLRAWLERLGARAQTWLGLHRLLGRRHAEYLASFMAMLEGGDVREGLRHAIPLAAMKALAARQPPARPWWGTPSARTSLTISPTRVAASSRLTLQDELYARLRQLYRQTFERLDAQGRHEEAAFVLAELLQQDEEAVAYLERHGELGRAAELAEARGCAAGLVVRAWFLAGNRERAVRVARERGAFHDAVVRLERTHPRETRALRLLWAEALASAGAYAEAIGVVRHLAEARGLLERWLELGLDLEEAEAPMLLAYQAALMPERWPQTRARADAWLAADDPGAAARRRALLAALPAVPTSPHARLLARHCARACLVRAASEESSLHPETLRALVRFADDPAFEADLPASVYVRRAGGARAPLLARIHARGSTPIRDAVLLPSGRWLVAQGDAGVALLAPAGHHLHQFDVPADGLVVGDRGDRAIAIAARGESVQLARLDLSARRARPWGLVQLSRFASSYDGSIWFVAQGRRLLALDALAEQPRCFWQVELPEEHAGVAAIARSPEKLAVVAMASAAERWLYELPGLTLRERNPVMWPFAPRAGEPGAEPRVLPLGLWTSPDALFSAALGPDAVTVVSHGAPSRKVHLGLPPVPVGAPFVCEGAATPGFFALALPHGEAIKVRLFNDALTLVAELDLTGAQRFSLRFASGHLMVACDGGQLVALDHDNGTVRTIAV